MAIGNPTADMSMCFLVAREAELQTLVDLWRTSRLVTLYGQAGVGKSALARAAAARLAGDQPDRVLSIDAGTATSSAAALRLLVRASRLRIADRGLQIRDKDRPVPFGQSPMRKSQSAMGTPIFVLLDDLPMAAHGAARGLLQWLVTHPAVHLLIVSRRPLDLLGEQTLPLIPLAPSSHGEETAPALDLFLACLWA
jgi:predicted ATPase